MKPDTDFREILWPIAFLYRENSSRNSGSTRVHRDTDSTCSRKIPFYCAKLNFTFVTYIYISPPEKHLLKCNGNSNIVCLITKFSFFFRFLQYAFPNYWNIIPSSIYYFFYFIIALFNFFLYFLKFFSLLKFPHSYNSTRFSRGRITGEQDCERINSKFGNIQE